MISDYVNGALKMIDLNSFNKALKLSWVRKYLNNDNSAKWKLLFDFQLQDYGGSEFFRCNLNRKDLSIYNNVPDSFIAKIVQIWAEISFDDSIRSIDHLVTLNLWDNFLIKVGNKPIYYKSWSAKGIQKVGHLMREKNKFLSFSEFKERFDINPNFLAFYGVISSIKTLKDTVKGQLVSEGNDDKFIDLFLRAKKSNTIVYQKCISSKKTSPSKTQNKWLADCNIICSNSINWKAAYKFPFRCTKISKLLVFHFKLLHRRLATNDFLNKIGFRQDDLCPFCGDDKESLTHLFWSCRTTILFLQNFQDWLVKNITSLKPNSSVSSAVVLGLETNFFSSTKHHFHFLVARYYIWTCKMREIIPRIEGFPSFLSAFSLPEITPNSP